MTMQPAGAHLVGSVPLASAEDVLRVAGEALGRHLATLPDGETGARKDWIAWQYAVLARTPGLEPIPAGDRGYLRRQLVRRAGKDPPRFGPLGYAEAARTSFAVFERLQRAGRIRPDVRFQVSLPTPLAPITVFVAPEDRAAVEPAYEARMLAELAEIGAAIPPEALAIQWDVAVELGHLEGVWPAHFADLERGIHARLARLAAAVPAGAELGFHLCYGDFGHRHFLEPPDATRLVALANALAPLRPAWLHLPVPIGWTAPASFAPLAALRLPAATRIYLGVVHARDGEAGARRRIAQALEVVPRFGIATECGWGRRPASEVPMLLRLHAELAAPIR